MDQHYDDTYQGERWTYGLTYRPLGYAQVPAGWIIWSDRPHATFQHGTVDYPRELTAQEISSYQLTPVA